MLTLELCNTVLLRSLTVGVSCEFVQSIFVEVLDCKC